LSPRAVRGELIAIAVVTGCLAAGPASAGEETRVVSGSRAVAEQFDFDLSVVWTHDEKRALIKRERESQSTGGQIAIANELVYRQRRDVLRLLAQAGVYRDVSVFLAAPLVLGDVRSLDFDRPGACTASAPGCVDESNATILRDGILPGFSSPSYGIDAPHDRAFEQPSDRLFRGPTRKGLESLGLGVRWAVFNEARDDTKPTWIVGLEGRFSLGQDMRFDPARPNGNTGVALGYHQLILSTVFGRRFGALEPYLGGSYLYPIATPASLYEQAHLGDNAFSRPQHRVGAQAGVESIAWEDERSGQRIAFLLRGHLELRLFGLAQSELWEPLSGSPLCGQDPMRCRPGVDADATGDGAPDPNPGLTRSPAYGVFGGDAGLGVQLGRLRFLALFGLTFEESHFLTDGRSGNETYDLPGRRFKVEDGRWWQVLVEAALTF
jgi:hypothetical protein